MKISVALARLILAAAACLRWYDSQQLAVDLENYSHLAAEAATLGIALDPSLPTDPIRTIRRVRENKEVTAKATAAAAIAFAKEVAASGKQNESPDDAQKQRIAELKDLMTSLDLAQLKIFVAEIRADTGLSEEIHQRMIDFCLTSLIEGHPQEAFRLLAESSDLLKDSDMMNESGVEVSLFKWAGQDPMAALEWVRANEEKFPELITEDSKRNLISGTVANDPKLALQFIHELGLGHTPRAFSAIGFSARTPEVRTATLAALRDYVATLPDEKARLEATAWTVASFTRGLAEDGFTSASQWIAEANFTPNDLENIANNLGGSIQRHETGQWIEWIGEKLPIGKSEAHIRELLEPWTQADYPAAGKWLASTPASPTKNVAIRSYAETVSTLDPATATQWAMTLPPGPDRDATLKHIQEHPPTK